MFCRLHMDYTGSILKDLTLVNGPQSYINKILPRCGVFKGQMQVRIYFVKKPKIHDLNEWNSLFKIYFIYFIFLLKYSWYKNIVLISAVQQSDSVIICIYIYIYTHILFYIFHYGLSQDIYFFEF